MSDTLFDAGPPEPPFYPPGVSADQKRRIRQDHLLAAGIHPITHLPLLTVETCGSCAHRIQVWGNSRQYPKCEESHISRGAATDVKASWPACAKWKSRG